MLEFLPSSLHLLLRSYILRSYYDPYSRDQFHLAEAYQTLLAEHLSYTKLRIEWCTDKDPAALSSLLLRQEGSQVIEIAQEGLAIAREPVRASESYLFLQLGQTGGHHHFPQHTCISSP